MQESRQLCGWLTALVAALWLVLSVPAYQMSGTVGLEGLSYAALVCLVPGWLVFLASAGYGVTSSPAMATFAATAVRMLFVLGSMLVIGSWRPELGFREFQLWLIVIYLVTLLAETMMLVRRAGQGTR